MSDSRKVRFTSNISNKEVKPLLPKKSPVPKLNMEITNPLEDLVQCSLCTNKFKQPKMLVCQHTFCLNCLQYNLPSGASVVKCAICNKTTNLQNGFESLEHLPGNMYIDSLLKVLSNVPNNNNINTNIKHCSECQTVCQFSEHTYNNAKQDLNTLHTLIDQLNDYDERLNHKIDTFQDRCSKIEESIRRTTEIKIKAIKQEEINCLKEIFDIKTNECAPLYNIKTRINDIKTKMNESNFDEFSQNALKVFDEVSRLPENKRFYFDVNQFKIERDDLEDGDNDAETEDEISQTTKIITNPLESHDTLIEHYKYRRFTSKFTWTKCARPAHIAIAPWNSNSIYIAATDNRNIYILDKQKFKLMGRLNDPNMLCPVGLTFSSEQLFVTDKWKHCIHVFSRQGNLIHTFGRKGSSPGQFRSPEGLVYHNSNRLFICDTGNDRIQVINAINGTHMYSFGITGAGKAVTGAGFVLDFKYTELNMPTGITISDNRVIVVDSGNKRVKIYTLEGSKLMEFGSLGKSKGQFRSPEVVAVDPLGFIFVGDSGNARVQVFRPNGSLVRVFGNKGNLAWVSGVCVTPQLEVIVSDYKSHTVHIF